MKRNLLFLFISVILITIMISATLYSPTLDGAPAGCTGSPADAKNCNACHKAKPKPMDGIMTINSVGNTFIPGKTYTIKVKLTGVAESKAFGFQISPQATDGSLLGKLIVTNKIETKIVKEKYINQTADGVDGKVSKIWSFDWVAPASGTKTVTFYGAFIIGGNPETLYNSTLTLIEAK